MNTYLSHGTKAACFGCGACAQACKKKAITLATDEEGFRYPVLDSALCINCGSCTRVCPHDSLPIPPQDKKYVFGGYNKDAAIRFESTSGGAFSALAKAFCDDNYVIFGAECKGLKVYHSYTADINELGKYRKSKYSQSDMGTVYEECKAFLNEGKKVLFSGTPCQIAALKNYLRSVDTTRLLTAEVVCEGVPSPLYMEKYNAFLEKKYGSGISSLDYRYTGSSIFKNGKWDFQVMRVCLRNGKVLSGDRWFNPFWSIWLNHLMSRPSCYECPFAKRERQADITMGDLWGVHLYCPELYGKNGGASVVFANTQKGREVLERAENHLTGHELAVDDAIRYQAPMRKHIDSNPKRGEFMMDLMSDMPYDELNRKWAKKPSLKLLWQKYIWGNRQKIALWNLLNSSLGDGKND